MYKSCTFAKKVLSFTITFALLAAGACFSKEIRLTTIMPTQDTLRVKQAAVGENFKDYPVQDPQDGSPFIGANNLIVEGACGIGTTVNPQAALTFNGGILNADSTVHGGSTNTHVNLGSNNSETGDPAVSTAYCTVGGGNNNIARGSQSTVGGGAVNQALGWRDVISGGNHNVADSTAGGSITVGGPCAATVGGGSLNTAYNAYATVGGGMNNTASGEGSTVAGGGRKEPLPGGGWEGANIASGDYSAIGGGLDNNATGEHTIVSGGENNTASGECSVVVGGRDNIASAPASVIVGGGRIASSGAGNVNDGWWSFIGAGNGNTISPGATGYAERSSIVGGNNNTIEKNESVICGGRENRISSGWSAIPGGSHNIIESNAPYSWAGGRQARVLATHTGSFVWGGTGGEVPPENYRDSNGVRSFNMYVTGGVWVNNDTQLADIAEEMFVLESDEIQEMELVSLKGTDLLEKTKMAYDENLTGVITSDRTCALYLQMPHATEKEDADKEYVTLVGRVFVKVTDHNGAIKVGDAITSSSTPGAGMKADRICKIVGYAMEEAEFDADGNAEVLTFVNLGYYVPEDAFKKLERRIEKLELALITEVRLP